MSKSIYNRDFFLSQTLIDDLGEMYSDENLAIDEISNKQNIIMTDSSFHSDLITSCKFSNVVIYRHLPIFFDLTKLNFVRYTASFYGYFYDNKSTHFNLALTMGLKRNLGLYSPYLFDLNNLFNLFNRFNYKSWRFVNYLVRNSYIKLSTSWSPYLSQQGDLWSSNFNNLSDISWNILSASNKFHRIIKLFPFDLDYSISSGYSDWPTNNLFYLDPCFLNLSFLINSNDSTIIISPQTYFMHYYILKAYSKLLKLRLLDFLVVAKGNFDGSLNILNIYMKNLFNIYLFNLQRHYALDKVLFLYFKILLFKILYKYFNATNIRYILIKLSNFSRKYIKQFFILQRVITLIYANKYQELSLFRKARGLMNFKRHSNRHYYLFKKIYRTNIISLRIFIHKRHKNFLKYNRTHSSLYILKRIKHLIDSAEENMRQNALSYYHYFWQEYENVTRGFIAKSIKFNYSCDYKYKTRYIKYDWIHNLYYNNHILFRSFVCNRWPSMEIIQPSKLTITWGRKYSQALYDIDHDIGRESFKDFRYDAIKLIQYKNFFNFFWMLFALLIRKNISFFFDLKQSESCWCDHSFRLLLFYFNFYYNYIAADQRLRLSKLKSSDHLFINYFMAHRQLKYKRLRFKVKLFNKWSS